VEKQNGRISLLPTGYAGSSPPFTYASGQSPEGLPSSLSVKQQRVRQEGLWTLPIGKLPDLLQAPLVYH